MLLGMCDFLGNCTLEWCAVLAVRAKLEEMHHLQNGVLTTSVAYAWCARLEAVHLITSRLVVGNDGHPLLEVRLTSTAERIAAQVAIDSDCVDM